MLFSNGSPTKPAQIVKAGWVSSVFNRLQNNNACLFLYLWVCNSSKIKPQLFSFRYPNISCELLTSDVSQINDRLGEEESLLIKLYSFLLNEPPLNPLLASFFSKVLSILISRKPEQVFPIHCF